MTEPHLILVGLMGAGKTTVGEVCGSRLRRPFVDTDALVEIAAGMTVADLFAHTGEGRFRALEREAVADACASPVPAVIACGGGAVLHADNRRKLKSAGFVVWLQASPAVLSERVGRGSACAERPLLAGGPATTLERMSVVRSSAYEAVADALIETDDRTINEVADVVLAAYQSSADQSSDDQS
jgi:shikimate kinase